MSRQLELKTACENISETIRQHKNAGYRRVITLARGFKLTWNNGTKQWVRAPGITPAGTTVLLEKHQLMVYYGYATIDRVISQLPPYEGFE